MKNLSTGTGLALLAGAALAYPFVSSLAPNANASAVTAAAAVSTAATGQATPTIVWYGVVHNDKFAFCSGQCNTPSDNYLSTEYSVLFRAWSDGKVEAMKTGTGTSAAGGFSSGSWYVVSSPAQGLTYRSDINFDEKVDGADLGALLTDWGNAPRQDIPPSDCPLALINP
jgi:hypothetical protein